MAKEQPEGMLAGGPEQSPIERLYGERIGLYPIPGRDLIEHINEAEVGENGDIGELSGVIDEAIAYGNGLVFGAKGEIYRLDKKDGESDLENKQRTEAPLIYLQNLFTTVEGSTERRNTLYLDSAVDEAIEGKVREAENWHSSTLTREKFRARTARKYAQINRQRLREGKNPLDSKVLSEDMEQEFREQERVLTNEYRAKEKLIRLGNRVRSSRIVGHAFIQRMGTCENPDLAANLLNQDRRYQPSSTPDKGHWKAYFEGEKGELRDRSLRAMVRVAVPLVGQERVIERGRGAVAQEVVEGIPTAIYATGFETTAMFKKWLSSVSEPAAGRMDVVLEAWQVALVWEIPSQLGRTITRKRDNSGRITEETIDIGDPPISNAIGPWVMHLSAKQRFEWGLDEKGNRLVAGKNPSHTGYPLNFLGPDRYRALMRAKGVMIEEIERRNPCESFLHESKVKLPKDLLEKLPVTAQKLADTHPEEEVRQDIRKILNSDPEAPGNIKLSLWDLWWYGELSFAGRRDDSGQTIEEFPWFQTEEVGEGGEGELPPGSFGGWLLRRFRAYEVVKDIRSRPKLQELADPEFFSDRTRNWDKVFDPVKNVPPGDKDYLEPYQNPRTWWVAGLIHSRSLGRPKSLINSDASNLDYRTFVKREALEFAREGMADTTAAVKDILKHALNAGFLRQVDVDWLGENIGI